MKWIHKRKIRKALKLERKNPKPWVYRLWEHTGWGDQIIIAADFRVRGWLPRRPNVGDSLHYKTESGGIARGIFVTVEYCHDPMDMFFAEIQPIELVSTPINPETKNEERCHP